MATKSQFDPEEVDSDFYSSNPNSKGNTDVGQDSETVETNANKDSTSDMNETHRMMSDEAAKKLKSVAENPSDDALFHRQDATYLEEGDDPNKGYDPHNMGYDRDGGPEQPQKEGVH